jgi:hypothetical protein
VELNRIPIFSSHERPSLVCSLRAYNGEEIKKMQKAVESFYSRGVIDKNLEDKLLSFIKDTYSQPWLSEYQSFSDQITITNRELWQKFFPDVASCPQLIYLELENLVGRLLIEHHLGQETIINKIVFNSQYHKLIEKYFNNIFGSFSLNNESGTFLFWAMPPGERYRIQLWLRNGFWESSDGKYKYALDEETIIPLLQKKELVPNLLLSFLVLAFYYGLKCLGGFNQVNYLTQMKQAYIALLNELGEEFNIEICEKVQTKEFVDGLTIAFLQGKNSELVPATGLDFLLYGGSGNWSSLVERAKSITLGEAFDPLLPELYQVIYPEVERQIELQSITAEQITRFNGFYDKVKPCLKIVN